MKVLTFGQTKAHGNKQEIKKLQEERNKLLQQIHPELDRINKLNERMNDLLMGAV